MRRTTVGVQKRTTATPAAVRSNARRPLVRRQPKPVSTVTRPRVLPAAPATRPRVLPAAPATRPRVLPAAPATRPRVLPAASRLVRRTARRVLNHRGRNVPKRGYSEKQIIHANRLAGPDGVRATGPPLETGIIPWPSRIAAAFSITIRSQRFEGMKARLGPWAKHVQMWTGTNGASVNIEAWKKGGKLHSTTNLRRGEIGCYDSHVRIWEHIVHNHIPLTLIMEDDANLRYIRHHSNEIEKALREADNVKGWHILYLGHNEKMSGKVSTSLSRPKGCQGLFGYLLTEAGAKICLSVAKPYQIPVDVLVSSLHDSGKLNALALIPRLFYVVPVLSDTAHIH